MSDIEERPFSEFVQDWLRRIHYAPDFYAKHTPVRESGVVRGLTSQERELVDLFSKERGYRRFGALRREA